MHVSQVAQRLIKHGHRLYTTLQSEADAFVKFTERDFLRRGREIEVFYARIDGWAGNDGLLLLRRSNPFAPCIWEINAPLEELRTRGISEKELLRLKRRRKELAVMVDAAVCVSDEMREYAEDELGIGKTFVIPNGSDPELFAPEKRDKLLYDETKYKVIWSGSPKYSWQGLKLVQELARKLKEKGINDVLIIVTADGVSSDNLQCLGHIPYTEMPRYIASADVGLCVYGNIDFYREFYFSPLKLYDYMASGLPVIGSHMGQIKHVIEENQNGLLTDNSIDDLIEKITFLKDNPGIAAAMGHKGRKAVVDKYNWEKVVLQTESVLLEAVKNRNTCLKGYPQYVLTAVTKLYSTRFRMQRWRRSFLTGMASKLKKSVVQLKGYF